MPRRPIPQRPAPQPDPVCRSQRVSKLINVLMLDGNKSAAERIVYGALDEIARQRNCERDEVLEIFDSALDNISPSIEVTSRRVGGATYQVPTEVRPARSEALALRWVTNAARNRSEKTMALCLARELLEASIQRGSAYQKNLEARRMAEANRTFQHFRV